MDQDKRLLHLPPLQMRLSMRSDCPYISGRTEQRVAVDISENPSLHDELARAGFRRVENWAYKPVCPQCKACLPWRVDVSRLRARPQPCKDQTRKQRPDPQHRADPPDQRAIQPVPEIHQRPAWRRPDGKYGARRLHLDDREQPDRELSASIIATRMAAWSAAS